MNSFFQSSPGQWSMMQLINHIKDRTKLCPYLFKYKIFFNFWNRPTGFLSKIMIGIPTEILEEFHCHLLLWSEKQKITEDKMQQNESNFDLNFVKAAEGSGILMIIPVGNPTGIKHIWRSLKEFQCNFFLWSKYFKKYWSR